MGKGRGFDDAVHWLTVGDREYGGGATTRSDTG